MPIKIEAFECNYCKQAYKDLRSANQHEIKCKSNQITKRCRTCIHSCINESVDPPYFCNIHKMSVLDKPYYIDVDKTGKSCKHYEYKGYSGWGTFVEPSKILEY